MTTMQKALQDCITALEEACGNRCNAEYNPCYAREAITQAKQVLANSAIDQMIEITQELGLYPAPKNEPTN